MAKRSGTWVCQNCNSLNDYQGSLKGEKCSNCGASVPDYLVSNEGTESEDITDPGDIDPDDYRDDGRLTQFKYHFLKPKKWGRRLIGIPIAGAGILSFILAIASVAANRDVDFIDKAFNAFLSKIPIIKRFLSDSGLDASRGERSLSRGSSSDDSGITVESIIKYSLILVLMVVFVPWIFSYIFAGTAAAGSAASPVVSPTVGWGDYIGDRAQVQAQPLAPSIEPVTHKVREGVAYISCIAEGPACYREWQLNNTQRPDSNRIGQTFLLSIDQFEIGQGGSFDVGYQHPDRSLETTYVISNTRRGVDGYEARDVSYSIRIFDQEKEYCSTESREVNHGFEGEGLGTNDLFPGATVTDFVTLNEFSIGNCEMMQPGINKIRNAAFDVEYGYSNMAILDFEAVSRQVFQEDGDIGIEEINSDAVDTPVTGAMSVRSPVLFDERGENSQPFLLTATLNTDKPNVEYQVENIEISSSENVDVNEASCDFEKIGETELGLTDRAENDLETEEDEKIWFDNQNSPPIFGCRMELEDTDELDARGETLTMRMETDYNIKLTEEMETFEIKNNQVCGLEEFNCPLLVTQDFNYDEDKTNYPGKWRYSCTGTDAARGCSVVSGEQREPEELTDVGYTRVDLHAVNQRVGDTECGEQVSMSNTGSLAEGEVAWDLWNLYDNLFTEYGFVQVNQDWSDFRGCLSQINEDEIEEELAIGLNPTDLQRLEQEGGWVLRAEGSGTVREAPSDVCSIEDFGDEVIAFAPDSEASEDCEDVDAGEANEEEQDWNNGEKIELTQDYFGE